MHKIDSLKHLPKLNVLHRESQEVKTLVIDLCDLRYLSLSGFSATQQDFLDVYRPQ